MSLLKGLANTAVAVTERDSLGGGSLFDTNVYPAKISMAYLQKSSKGSLGVFLHFLTEDGRTIRQSVYITGGDAKGNKATYTDKEGKEQYLPGYILVNSLALLAAGEPLDALDTPEKAVKVWNKDAKAEVMTKVPVIEDLIGKQIKVAVEKQLVDKTTESSPGVYVATGETREQNEVVKFFRYEDDMTTSEIIAEAETAAFMQEWIKKNAGQVINKSGKAPTGGGTAGAPKAAAPAQKPKSSLFGGKKTVPVDTDTDTTGE